MTFDARITALGQAIHEAADWDLLGRRIREAVEEAADLQMSPVHVRGRVSAMRHTHAPNEEAVDQ